MTPTLDAALLCSSRAGSDLGRESGLVWGALFTWCNVPIMGPYIQVESLGLHIIVFMIIGRPIVIAISQFNSCNTKKIKHARWSNLENVLNLSCFLVVWSIIPNQFFISTFFCFYLILNQPKKTIHFVDFFTLSSFDGWPYTTELYNIKVQVSKYWAYLGLMHM